MEEKTIKHKGKKVFGTIATFAMITLPPMVESAYFSQNSFAIEQKEVAHLGLNTSDQYYTVAEKGHPEGIIDLIHTARDERLEEAMAFIPSRERWVEIGYHSFNTDDKKTVRHDLYLKDRLIRKHEELFLYHTHPMFEDLDVIEREPCAIRPSETDLKTLIHDAKKFYTRHPAGKMVHRICSPYGVTEYMIRKETLDDLGDITFDYGIIENTFDDIVLDNDADRVMFRTDNFIFTYHRAPEEF